ncbi:hypothetical protein L3X38_038567 [Prunus dulcis]|uniref:Retroviral polymerase SH3-like domain-containing protein n=1 Tax=Prunus dulcis TaxID=3755 RepID=A0AAD4V6R0_PRUDU|nr:hypothetical protein L3X38_038567 [Prunus dulcis]
MIEHSKDLETLEVQEVVASLKSFERRLDRHAKNSIERAFASLNVREAVNTVAYLLNGCPTKALNKTTPFEAYSGRKPGIAHLKVFGSLCYAHIPSNLKHKLEENNRKCIFVGYGASEKGYRVFDPSSRKIILSRDVLFYENAAWKWENTDKNEMRVPMIAENQMANCSKG